MARYEPPRIPCQMSGCTNQVIRRGPNQKYCSVCSRRLQEARSRASFQRRYTPRLETCECGATFSPHGAQKRCNDCRFAPSANPLRKLHESDVRVIRARYEAGDTAGKIAKDYGMARSTIYAIVDWQTWRHVS